MSVPWIDPEVDYLPLNRLRSFDYNNLTQKTFILMKHSEPLAVIVPYKVYLELQSLAELPKVAKAKA